MRPNIIFGAMAGVMLLSAVAYAQNAPPANRPTQAQPVAPKKHAGEWRSSKLIGLDVHNMQNEKVGDINEILLRASGQVAGVVVGVGGFLGMGEHDVLLSLDQIKLVNEPVRTSTGPAVPNTTGDRTSRDQNRAANEKWYPDHAVVNATKDQLKAMPQFKYSDYN
jgi:hypothetical protein